MEAMEAKGRRGKAENHAAGCSFDGWPRHPLGLTIDDLRGFAYLLG